MHEHINNNLGASLVIPLSAVFIPKAGIFQQLMVNFMEYRARNIKTNSSITKYAPSIILNQVSERVVRSSVGSLANDEALTSKVHDVCCGP